MSFLSGNFSRAISTIYVNTVLAETYPLPAEFTSGDQESLISFHRIVNCPNMGGGYISYIDPSPIHCWRDLGISPSGHKTPDLRVRLIEASESDVMLTRSKNHRRLNGDDVEMRLLRLHEFPGRFFGKSLAGAITSDMGFGSLSFFPRYGVPILF